MQPLELTRTDISFVIDGQEFTVDAYEAAEVLDQIDTLHEENAPQRWRSIREYIAGECGSECTKGQAIQFYNAVIDACEKFDEEDKKKRGISAGSPTDTESTPEHLASGNGEPGSPTSTAAKPNSNSGSATCPAPS